LPLKASLFLRAYDIHVFQIGTSCTVDTGRCRIDIAGGGYGR
jgi:hypothetical protein